MAYDYYDDTRRASESLRRSRAAARARKERRRKLMIRRTLIVLIGLAIAVLAIVLVVMIGKWLFGGGSSDSAIGVVTATVSDPFAEPADSSGDTQATQPQKSDALTFKEPTIHDDGTTTGSFSNTTRGVYIYDGIACELFGWYDEIATDYAAAISEFKEKSPDFSVYSMVVPNHTEFALPRRLLDEVGTMPQVDNIKAIYESLSSAVQPINCYNALCDHINEYIYFNTDHHWSGLGAYYAYAAFCEQTGQTALKLSDCTEHTISDFEGTLYDSSLQNGLDTVHWWEFPYETHAMRQDNPGEDLYRTTVYYEQEGSGQYSYGVFIWGDAPLFVCYNDELNNGKKIAVVKESYGNAFAPYLTNNYEEVHVVDMRYFDGSLTDYMRDNGIDEVIFVNNVMQANNPDMIDRIRELK